MPPEKIPTTGSRLVSMILDHVIMSMIGMIFFLPSLFQGFAGAFRISHEQKFTGHFLNGPFFYLGLFGFGLYFCKDCINGRSIAKRMCWLQVVDNTSGQVASPIKCFVRNLFCVLWPIEGIAILLNPARRIGDYVAGTLVVNYDPIAVVQPAIRPAKLLLPLGLSYGLLLFIMLPFRALLNAGPRYNYLENSYNTSESKALEQLFADSMGQHLSASVRVYDKIEMQHLKYISIIYKLKENYLEDPATADNLRAMTDHYLYSMFPETTITGQAQYVFQVPGSIQTSMNRIGTLEVRPKK